MARTTLPLPRKALVKIDDAVMDLSKALYELEELRSGRRLILADIKLTGADCIIYINRAIDTLKAVQAETKQDSKTATQENG